MSAVNPATSLVVSPQRRLGVTLCLVAALAACQKSDKLPTTAERLKNVEVRQQVEPESYLPRKSVDNMATMKDLNDAPDKPDAAKAEPKAASPNAPLVLLEFLGRFEEGFCVFRERNERVRADFECG